MRQENPDITTWKEEIESAFEDTKDTWEDVIANTLSEEELNRKFDGGFGGSRGTPFTLWTKNYVYFPCVYDGSEWVGYVSRNPNGEPTFHMGGE